MKNNKITGIILIILVAFACILNFLPRANYAYPLHVDEYVHFQYANHLSNNAPEYFGGDKITLENGFHVLLATLNSFGITYLIIFRFLPILFTVILCLCVFVTTRRIFNAESGLFAVLFIALLNSTPAIIGPMFLVPLTIGMILISIGAYFLDINSKLFVFVLASLLIIHPPSALAYFIIINIFFVKERKNFVKNISYEALAFLIALPLYIPTFMQKGAESVNNLNFTSIIPPLFIPRFLGYFAILVIGIGIYYSSMKKRYDLIYYVLSFLFLVLLFYKLDIEFFVPYARTLMYLFLIFSILFGYGSYKLSSIGKNKNIKIAIALALIVIFVLTALPSKIDSTRYVYQVMNDRDFKAFNFIKDNTAKEAIVISEPWKANALTPFAERLVYSRIVQGPNEFYENRNKEIKKFFDDGCVDLEFLKENNISVVYGNCTNSKLKEVYDNVFTVNR